MILRAVAKSVNRCFLFRDPRITISYIFSPTDIDTVIHLPAALVNPVFDTTAFDHVPPLIYGFVLKNCFLLTTVDRSVEYSVIVGL